jgi:hypothetical protein
MERSEAPADPRPYVRVSTDLPLNPKLAAIDDPAASWAYVVSLCYCGGSLTDGLFPVAAVIRLAGVAMANAMALVEQGLWHQPGHDCRRCPQPKTGQAVIHDYLRHQRSADEARTLTEKRREAGRKGAKSRWGEGKQDKPAPKTNGKPIASAIANAMPSAMANGWQSDSRGEERRGDIQTPTVSAAPPPATPPAQQPSLTQRSKKITDAYAEAEPLCRWPAINGVVLKALKTGRYSDDEIKAALLRLASDNRPVTVETIRIELNGMPASNLPARINGANGRKPSTTDQRVGAALELATRYAQEEQ